MGMSGTIDWTINGDGNSITADPSPLADGKMVVGSGDTTVKTVVDVYIEPVTGALVSETDVKLKGIALQLIAAGDSDVLGSLYEETGGDGAIVLNNQAGVQSLFLGTEDASGDAALVCNAAKNLRLGRSTSSPAVTIADKMKLATVAAAATGDIGMGSDGRASVYTSVGGVASERGVVVAGDIWDDSYINIGAIATASATVIRTIPIATGAVVVFEIFAAVQFQDHTAAAVISRRCVAVNNGGTVTVGLQTAAVTACGAGSANIDGDTVDLVVNGTNVDMRLDPETATGRYYKISTRSLTQI